MKREKMKLNNKVYEFFKWLVQIFLPALGVLYFALSEVWGFPHALGVMATLSAIGTFLGVILGISTASYRRANEPEAGYITQTGVDEDGGMPNIGLTLTKLPADILSKKTVTFKVNTPTTQVEPNVRPPA